MRLLATMMALSVSCALAQSTSGAPLNRAQNENATAAGKPAALAARSATRQAGPRSAAPADATTDKNTNVPPNTALITLHGVCSDQQAKAPCKTVITREDLDRFINAYFPNAPGTARARLAVQYARTLTYSALAQQQGLAKDPALDKELKAELELVRARVLANAFLRSLQEKKADIPEAEVQKYYDAHRTQYETILVRRLSVPLSAPTENGRPLDRSAIKPYMEGLRKRAIAGEDFNALQEAAYKYFHIQVTPPPVTVSTLNQMSMQGVDGKALDLNPGDVSEVLDSVAAVVIIKVESKEMRPIAAVRQEIEAALRGNQMQDQLNALTKSIDPQFNLKYFELPVQPDIFGSAVKGPAAPQAVNPAKPGGRP
jgi:hypothetical protein